MKDRIFSFGAAYFEINGLDHPIPESGQQVDKEYVGGGYEVNPGGSAVYFARICAGLGLKPLFVGKIGTDRLGRNLKEMLQDEGIATDFIESSEVQTNTALNFNSPLGAVQNVNGSANQSITPYEVEDKFKEKLSEVDILYLGGGFKMKQFMAEYPHFIELAHSHGVKVVLDHGRVTNAVTEEDKEKMRDIVGLVDYYFPSKDEFLSLWDAESIEAGLDLVKSKTSAIVAVKDAENGAIGLQGDETIHVPAFPVTVINSVGAGDSFNAGFIRAQIDGKSLEDSLRFACATAAIKVSESGIPTIEKIEQRLNI